MDPSNTLVVPALSLQDFKYPYNQGTSYAGNSDIFNSAKSYQGLPLLSRCLDYIVPVRQPNTTQRCYGPSPTIQFNNDRTPGPEDVNLGASGLLAVSEYPAITENSIWSGGYNSWGTQRNVRRIPADWRKTTSFINSSPGWLGMTVCWTGLFLFSRSVCMSC